MLPAADQIECGDWREWNMSEIGDAGNFRGLGRQYWRRISLTCWKQECSDPSADVRTDLAYSIDLMGNWYPTDYGKEG